MTDTVAQTYPTSKAGANVRKLCNNSHSFESVPPAALAEAPTGPVFSERQLEDQ
jgi:hypothetical protein